MAKGGGA